MKRLFSIAVAAVLLLGTACDLQKPSETVLQKGQSPGDRAPVASRGNEEPVAIVNGEVITHDEFQRRIQQLAPFARARLSSIEQRKKYLDSVVQFEIMADEAEKRGYGDDPAVLQAMKDVMIRKMIQEEVRERVSMSDITEDEVEQYYREHRGEFRKPESRRIALLLVDTQEEAQNIRASLIENQPEAQDQRVLEFRKMAANLTTDREAAREGGDVGWIEHPDARPKRIKLSREVFKLEQPGVITEPFRLRDKWALATYFNKRSGSDKKLEDVRESIRETLYADKKKEARDAFIAELQKDARVEKHQDVIESVEAPVDDQTPTLEDIPTVPIRDLRGDRGAANDEESSEKKDEQTP
ncbi:MAG: peptidyl-prolyl cis-trans isomerase [Myxococcota bacterium]